MKEKAEKERTETGGKGPRVDGSEEALKVIAKRVPRRRPRKRTDRDKAKKASHGETE